MGGIGSGWPKGKPRPKSNKLRIAPMSDAVRIDLWDIFRRACSGQLMKEGGAYLVEHKGDTVAIEIKGGDGALWINGARVDVTYCGTEKRVEPYQFRCPNCGNTIRAAFIYKDKVGCRSCLGLYPRYFGKHSSLKALMPAYEALKEEYAKAQAFYDEYAAGLDPTKHRTYGHEWPIKSGMLKEPYLYRKKLEKMKARLKSMELKLWTKAGRGIYGSVEYEVTGDMELDFK